MKYPCLYFEVKLLKEFARNNGGYIYGNNYEIMTAIMMRGFFKKVNNINYKIAFSLQERFIKYYHKNYSPVNIESFKYFFENHKNEDLDSDFILIPENNLKYQPIYIQAKRFGHFQEGKTTENLIAFLEKFPKKYSKTDTILVIFFDGHKGMDIEKVHESINKIEFPFMKGMYINTNKNENDKWITSIGEFYPNFGYNNYDPFEITSE